MGGSALFVENKSNALLGFESKVNDNQMKMQRTKLFGTLLLALMIVVGSSCNKENGGGGSNNEESGKPKVETAAVRDITDTDAKGGGTILDDGGSDIIGRGICWGKGSTPTVDSSHIAAVGTEESFTCLMANLTPSTTYYVRAYAINDKGVGYGNEVSFQTDAETNKPKLETSMASEITETSAVTGGVIINDGGSDIFERGVCWSTNQNPGVSDCHITAGTGAGSFTCEITELEESTTYYVRAYAINGNGIGYGPEISFTTHGRPKVTTAAVTDITQTSAVCGGTVTDECSSPVDERGVCWSTSHNPSYYYDNTVASGTGGGSFSIVLNLNAGTTYYVRAYAINESGIGYGEEMTFTTLPAPTGAINGVFSVSATNKVWFSMGNLQYQASSNTWRFAEHQYNICGNDNYSISSTTDKWIDLFGWGTSGYNHGAVCYHPWSTSQNSSDYYAYGSNTYNLYDQSGQADWGYNPIYNGGNQTNQWRTLTKEEWEYLLNNRNTISGKRFVKATVNNTEGVVLLPDNWKDSMYGLNGANSGNTSFNSNLISGSIWNSLAANGCVFLPNASNRIWFDGPGIIIDSFQAGYWSSTTSDSDSYVGLFFNDSSSSNNLFIIGGIRMNYNGYAVRLVCDVE